MGGIHCVVIFSFSWLSVCATEEECANWVTHSTIATAGTIPHITGINSTNNLWRFLNPTNTTEMLIVRDPNPNFIGDEYLSESNPHYYRSRSSSLECSNDGITFVPVNDYVGKFSCDEFGVGNHSCGNLNGWIFWHRGVTINENGGHACHVDRLSGETGPLLEMQYCNATNSCPSCIQFQQTSNCVHNGPPEAIRNCTTHLGSGASGTCHCTWGDIPMDCGHVATTCGDACIDQDPGGGCTATEPPGCPEPGCGYDDTNLVATIADLHETVDAHTTSLASLHTKLDELLSALAVHEGCRECSISSCDEAGMYNAASRGLSHVCGDHTGPNLGLALHECVEDQTYFEAQRMCIGQNLRLCTAQELVSNEGYGVCERVAQSMYDGTFKRTNTNTYQECCNLCWEDPDCIHISYRDGGDICLLFTSLDSPPFVPNRFYVRDGECSFDDKLSWSSTGCDVNKFTVVGRGGRASVTSECRHQTETSDTTRCCADVDPMDFGCCRAVISDASSDAMNNEMGGSEILSTAHDVSADTFGTADVESA